MDVRFATFNASLNRNVEGQLVADLSTPDNAQARTIAEIIQRTSPDVLLVNEFDFVEDGVAAELFRDNYLEVPQNGADPVEYPYYFVAPSNTGIPTGFDLNNNGVIGGGDDAFGFGLFPGQFGMAVYSKYPIDHDAVRTFQHFLWKDMPGACCRRTSCPADFYSPEEQDILRLSSKSHWDVPISLSGRRPCTSSSATRPRPPSTAPRTATGRRNHDEIRFWADYISARHGVATSTTTRARTGGLQPGERSSSPATRTPTPRRRLGRRARSSSCSTTRGSTDGHADQRGRRRGERSSGRRQPRAPATRPRHGGLQRQPGPGQPARRLRAAAAGPADPRRRGLLAGPGRPAVPPHRRLPLPVERPPPRLGRRAPAALSQTPSRMPLGSLPLSLTAGAGSGSSHTQVGVESG